MAGNKMDETVVVDVPNPRGRFVMLVEWHRLGEFLWQCTEATVMHSEHDEYALVFYDGPLMTRKRDDGLTADG